MNGFTGRSGPVMRCPGGVPAGRGGAAAGAGGARRGGAGGGARRGGAGMASGGRASAADGFTGNTLLHTAQRARTPPAGTLAGSTRYTVSHDGQVTFTATLPSARPAQIVGLGVVAAIDDEHRSRLGQIGRAHV